MMILSRVCARFHNARGETLLTVTPAMRNIFTDAPETIREDPLFNLDYYLGAFRSGDRIAPAQDKVPNRHMFAATASSPRSDIRVVVTAADGTVLHEEAVRRPKAFGPRMQ